MKKLAVALIVGVALAIPVQPLMSRIAFAAPAYSPAARTGLASPTHDNACKPKKAYKCKDEQTVPSHGSFQAKLSLDGTSLTLRGAGTRTTSGTRILLGRAVAPHTPTRAHAFKVFTTGRIPALRLVGRGQLYRYSVATKTWSKIAVITGPGIYAVSVS